ncbi:hypothetical protein EMVG_00287 [Emiliania huxleyi virus PS401]|nr:hypothetical protein EMVG_00287 [Emiliania huxleyi virus PS401]
MPQSYQYKVVRMIPSSSCVIFPPIPVEPESTLSLPLTSSISPVVLPSSLEKPLGRVVSPMGSVMAPLLGENASEADVKQASLLTCSNLLVCVPCVWKTPSHPCIDVDSARCAGQAFRSADACRNTGRPLLVNEYDYVADYLRTSGSESENALAWLTTNRNLDYVLGTNCGLAFLKCASSELCEELGSCEACDTEGKVRFAAVQVGEVLFGVVANHTLQGWVDITSTSVLRAIYEDAASQLDNPTVPTDSDADTLIGDCATNSKAFFELFGFVPLPPSAPPPSTSPSPPPPSLSPSPPPPSFPPSPPSPPPPPPRPPYSPVHVFPSPLPPPMDDGGLSTAAIAGIIIGGVFISLLTFLLTFLACASWAGAVRQETEG